MSDSRQAVFLSYASHDDDAARRICDALRTADVEVWFDQSELRGGDAWDGKIRQQIKDCVLPAGRMPAISEVGGVVWRMVTCLTRKRARPTFHP